MINLLHERVCPVNLRRFDEYAPIAEYNARVYDQCDLKRYELLTREEFIAHHTGGELMRGHLLYQWLQDQGAPAKQSKALVRALILTPRGPWASFELHGDQRLPSTAHGVAVPMALPITLRPGALSIEGNERYKLDHRIRIENAATTDYLPQLANELTANARRARTRMQASGKTWLDQIILVSHRDTPWSTVMIVAKTAAVAGFGHISALVLVDDPVRPFRSLDIHRADAPPSNLRLEITTNDGAQLRCGKRSVMAAKLSDLATMAARCNASDVEVIVDGDVPLHRVVMAIDILYPRRPRISAID